MLLVGVASLTRVILVGNKPSVQWSRGKARRRPVMAKSYFSEPVRVSVDELMTELLRRVPEHDIADVLRNACFNAEHRTRDNRHMRYKCQRFFRRLVLRLSNLPEDLAVVVGITKPSPQLQLPDMSVETSPTEHNEYEEALDRMAAEDEQAEEAPESEPSEDDLWAHLDIPEFDDFKQVFDSYPYVCRLVRKGHGPLLVLGYASGRHRKTSELIRRNCALNEVPFNSVVSILGLFKRQVGDIHQHVKVVKYRPGLVLRSWTNIQGQGDRPDMYRYLVCGEEEIHLVDKVEYNQMLEAWEECPVVCDA